MLSVEYDEKTPLKGVINVLVAPEGPQLDWTWMMPPALGEESKDGLGLGVGLGLGLGSEEGVD